MNRSLDSVLDSVLASINLDNSSSSDDVLVTPVNTRGILFADQVELSHRPLLSAVSSKNTTSFGKEKYILFYAINNDYFTNTFYLCKQVRIRISYKMIFV